MISKSGARTVCHQLTELKENPVEREFSNSLDPMLNSNSEQVSILSTPTLAENQVSLSAQTFIPDNSKLISLDISKDYVVSYSDKSSPNLEESILNTNTPVVDRKDITQSLNPVQILL